jgi:hypothetical protein
VRGDDAGVGEDPEVPADGVLVQPEPRRQLRDAEAAGRRFELVDDARSARIGECAMPAGLVHFHRWLL